jgi:hypothetical protein
MKKQFLSIILLVNVVPLIAMEGDDTDKRLITNMTALEINQNKVDAWDALGKDKKKEVKSTLEKLANQYNEYFEKHDKERVLSEEQFKKAVKQSYLSIKRSIREGNTTLPTNPSEKDEKQYYYDDCMKGRIQMVLNPGAVCLISHDHKVEFASDSEDEG